jgi:hypothetical protein
VRNRTAPLAFGVALSCAHSIYINHTSVAAKQIEVRKKRVGFVEAHSLVMNRGRLERKRIRRPYGVGVGEANPPPRAEVAVAYGLGDAPTPDPDDVLVLVANATGVEAAVGEANELVADVGDEAAPEVEPPDEVVVAIGVASVDDPIEEVAVGLTVSGDVPDDAAVGVVESVDVPDEDEADGVNVPTTAAAVGVSGGVAAVDGAAGINARNA